MNFLDDLNSFNSQIITFFCLILLFFLIGLFLVTYFIQNQRKNYQYLLLAHLFLFYDYGLIKIIGIVCGKMTFLLLNEEIFQNFQMTEMYCLFWIFQMIFMVLLGYLKFTYFEIFTIFNKSSLQFKTTLQSLLEILLFFSISFKKLNNMTFFLIICIFSILQILTCLQLCLEIPKMIQQIDILIQIVIIATSFCFYNNEQILYIKLVQGIGFLLFLLPINFVRKILINRNYQIILEFKLEKFIYYSKCMCFLYHIYTMNTEDTINFQSNFYIFAQKKGCQIYTIDTETEYSTENYKKQFLREVIQNFELNSLVKDSPYLYLIRIQEALFIQKNIKCALKFFLEFQSKELKLNYRQYLLKLYFYYYIQKLKRKFDQENEYKKDFIQIEAVIEKERKLLDFVNQIKKSIQDYQHILEMILEAKSTDYQLSQDISIFNKNYRKTVNKYNELCQKYPQKIQHLQLYYIFQQLTLGTPEELETMEKTIEGNRQNMLKAQQIFSLNEKILESYDFSFLIFSKNSHNFNKIVITSSNIKEIFPLAEKQMEGQNLMSYFPTCLQQEMKKRYLTNTILDLESNEYFRSIILNNGSQDFKYIMSNVSLFPNLQKGFYYIIQIWDVNFDCSNTFLILFCEKSGQIIMMNRGLRDEIFSDLDISSLKINELFEGFNDSQYQQQLQKGAKQFTKINKKFVDSDYSSAFINSQYFPNESNLKLLKIQFQTKNRKNDKSSAKSQSMLDDQEQKLLEENFFEIIVQKIDKIFRKIFRKYFIILIISFILVFLIGNIMFLMLNIINLNEIFYEQDYSNQKLLNISTQIQTVTQQFYFFILTKNFKKYPEYFTSKMITYRTNYQKLMIRLATLNTQSINNISRTIDEEANNNQIDDIMMLYQEPERIQLLGFYSYMLSLNEKYEYTYYGIQQQYEYLVQEQTQDINNYTHIQNFIGDFQRNGVYLSNIIFEFLTNRITKINYQSILLNIISTIFLTIGIIIMLIINTIIHNSLLKNYDIFKNMNNTVLENQLRNIYEYLKSFHHVNIDYLINNSNTCLSSRDQLNEDENLLNSQSESDSNMSIKKNIASQSHILKVFQIHKYEILFYCFIIMFQVYFTYFRINYNRDYKELIIYTKRINYFFTQNNFYFLKEMERIILVDEYPLIEDVEDLMVNDLNFEFLSLSNDVQDIKYLSQNYKNITNEYIANFCIKKVITLFPDICETHEQFNQGILTVYQQYYKNLQNLSSDLKKEEFQNVFWEIELIIQSLVDIKSTLYAENLNFFHQYKNIFIQLNVLIFILWIGISTFALVMSLLNFRQNKSNLQLLNSILKSNHFKNEHIQLKRIIKFIDTNLVQFDFFIIILLIFQLNLIMDLKNIISEENEAKTIKKSMSYYPCLILKSFYNEFPLTQNIIFIKTDFQILEQYSVKINRLQSLYKYLVAYLRKLRSLIKAKEIKKKQIHNLTSEFVQQNFIDEFLYDEKLIQQRIHLLKYHLNQKKKKQEQLMKVRFKEQKLMEDKLKDIQRELSQTKNNFQEIKIKFENKRRELLLAQIESNVICIELSENYKKEDFLWNIFAEIREEKSIQIQYKNLSRKTINDFLTDLVKHFFNQKIQCQILGTTLTINSLNLNFKQKSNLVQDFSWKLSSYI